jgi:hypothetical protein
MEDLQEKGGELEKGNHRDLLTFEEIVHMRDVLLHHIAILAVLDVRAQKSPKKIHSNW